MNTMLTAVQITTLGMGLVFVAIIVLWAMMNLLTLLTADKDASSASRATASDSAESPDEEAFAPIAEGDFRAQAAAVAVAIAAAEQQALHVQPLPAPPTAIVSAWQLGMRTRQMYQKGISIRRRVRQDGK